MLSQLLLCQIVLLLFPAPSLPTSLSIIFELFFYICVSICHYNKRPENIKGIEIYFYLGFQSTLSWFCCVWACGGREHSGAVRDGRPKPLTSGKLKGAREERAVFRCARGAPVIFTTLGHDPYLPYNALICGPSFSPVSLGIYSPFRFY